MIHLAAGCFAIVTMTMVVISTLGGLGGLLSRLATGSGKQDKVILEESESSATLSKEAEAPPPELPKLSLEEKRLANLWNSVLAVKDSDARRALEIIGEIKETNPDYPGLRFVEKDLEASGLIPKDRVELVLLDWSWEQGSKEAKARGKIRNVSDEAMLVTVELTFRRSGRPGSVQTTLRAPPHIDSSWDLRSPAPSGGFDDTAYVSFERQSGENIVWAKSGDPPLGATSPPPAKKPPPLPPSPPPKLSLRAEATAQIRNNAEKPETVVLGILTNRSSVRLTGLRGSVIFFSNRMTRGSIIFRTSSVEPGSKIRFAARSVEYHPEAGEITLRLLSDQGRVDTVVK